MGFFVIVGILRKNKDGRGSGEDLERHGGERSRILDGGRARFSVVGKGGVA